MYVEYMAYLALNEVTHYLVIKIVNWSPFDTLLDVLLLLSL